jgi:isochorismate synthase
MIMTSDSTTLHQVASQQDYTTYSIISRALAAGDSLALWRLPNQTVTQLLLSRKPVTLTEEQGLEDLSSGFIIAPFLPSSVKTFLPADYFFRIEDNKVLPPLNALENASHAWLHQHTEKSAGSLRFHVKPLPSGKITGQDDFIKLVQKSMELIDSKSCEKIVPSRSKRINTAFDAFDAFEKLCKKYPAAMVTLISVPSLGTWVGATPEVLVSVENRQWFKTVALAGTKAWQEGMDLKSVAWTQKEIEEQALVERYVISCFKKIRLREYEEHGPKTMVAGNLLHLKSDFTVDMKAVNFPQLGSVMLKLLHPTSAVCGMPLETSLPFLQQQEGYDRELYSGYWGPVNINNDIHIFVNLRCMQMQHNGAILYAGAGVTEDSVPQKEWEETEMKMHTLLSVINE